MKRIAIFGGSGFIGSNLVEHLSKAHEVQILILDIEPPPSTPINTTYHFFDIRDARSDYSICEGVDYIFVLASLLGKRCTEEPGNGWSTNFSGLFFLFDGIKGFIKRPLVFFSSSCMVYGQNIQRIPIHEEHPILGEDIYSLSKVYGENLLQSLCKTYGFVGIVFRFFTVFGAGPASAQKGHFIRIWLENALQKNNITIFGNGCQTIDLTHVDDVCGAIIALLDKSFEPGTFEVFNVATGVETEVNTIAEWFREVIPSLRIDYNSKVTNFPHRKVALIDKAKHSLGYFPTTNTRNMLIKLVKDTLHHANY